MIDKETVANLLPEPDDGAVLVVFGDDEYKAIWRDDAAASGWGAAPGDCWFDDNGEHPMALFQHVKDAEAVYALPEQPLVRFFAEGGRRIRQPLQEFARWLVSFGDPDPASVGFRERRAVTMTGIIERARRALGETEGVER